MIIKALEKLKFLIFNKKLIFILSFILISNTLSAERKLLEIGDSLFIQGKYQLAKNYYDSLFYEYNTFSNSLLLKLSFIEDYYGNYEKSIYYLTILKNKDKNIEAQKLLDKLINENDLNYYEESDFDLFKNYYLQYRNTMLYLLFSIIILIFLINAHFHFKNKKMVSIKSFFLLCFFLIFLANFKFSREGIILNDNTFIMNQPSSGSDVFAILKKGEKLKISDELDNWYEVSLNESKKFIRKKNLLLINQ